MKTTNEIYAEMKRCCEERTGLALPDGGDMAVRLYAAAAQLESLWAQADFLERQSFPQTASGEYLERQAAMRGLNRRASAKSVGVVRFHIASALTEALTVPAGTRCETATETAFVTTAAATIPAGSLYADAPAEAVSAGAGGNVPAGSITVTPLPPTGITRCSNPAPFAGGAEEETDEALRSRVLSSYKKLPNGANAAYYELQALSVPGVAAAGVYPKLRGAGTVDVVISSLSGVPADALVSAVQSRLNAQREICVDIDVSAPTAAPVAVTASVKAGAGYTYAAVKTAVEQAVAAFFSGELLGRDVLRAELCAVIYSVPGVINYTLTAPAADVTAQWNTLPTAGTVTITEMS